MWCHGIDIEKYIPCDTMTKNKISAFELLALLTSLLNNLVVGAKLGHEVLRRACIYFMRSLFQFLFHVACKKMVIKWDLGLEVKAIERKTQVARAVCIGNSGTSLADKNLVFSFVWFCIQPGYIHPLGIHREQRGLDKIFLPFKDLKTYS